VPNVIRPGTVNRLVNESFDGGTTPVRETSSDSIPEAADARRAPIERANAFQEPAPSGAGGAEPPGRDGTFASNQDPFTSSPPAVTDSATAPFVGTWFNGVPPTATSADDNDDDTDTFGKAPTDTPGRGDSRQADLDLIYAPPEDVPQPPGRSAEREVSSDPKPTPPVFTTDMGAFTSKVQKGLGATR
jgi:hypothetical protein